MFAKRCPSRTANGRLTAQVFSTPARSAKMVVETARCVWLRRHHVALWRFVEPHPFRDCAPVEPRLTDNRADALAGKL